MEAGGVRGRISRGAGKGDRAEDRKGRPAIAQENDEDQTDQRHRPRVGVAKEPRAKWQRRETSPENQPLRSQTSAEGGLSASAHALEAQAKAIGSPQESGEAPRALGIE